MEKKGILFQCATIANYIMPGLAIVVPRKHANPIYHPPMYNRNVPPMAHHGQIMGDPMIEMPRDPIMDPAGHPIGRDNLAYGGMFSILFPPNRMGHHTLEEYMRLMEARRGASLQKEIAISTIEQICPFPFDLFEAECKKYLKAKLVFVQEEHENKGSGGVTW